MRDSHEYSQCRRVSLSVTINVVSEPENQHSKHYDCVVLDLINVRLPPDEIRFVMRRLEDGVEHGV